MDPERMLGWCRAFAAMNALEVASQADGSRGHIEALLALASQAPTQTSTPPP